MDEPPQEIHQQMASIPNASYTINGLLNIPSGNLIKNDCVRQDDFGKTNVQIKLKRGSNNLI